MDASVHTTPIHHTPKIDDLPVHTTPIHHTPKMDVLPVHTTPIHHTPKMDILPKSFLRIILDAIVWHSSTVRPPKSSDDLAISSV